MLLNVLLARPTVPALVGADKTALRPLPAEEGNIVSFTYGPGSSES